MMSRNDRKAPPQRLASESKSEDSIACSVVGSLRGGTMDFIEKQQKEQPLNTRLRQQKLRARQPIMRPYIVISGFLAVGIILAFMGGIMLGATASVFHWEKDYSDCDLAIWQCNSDENGPTSIQPCYCQFDFTIPKGGIKGAIYFYYGFSNYYQNLRRYVFSLMETQFIGYPSGHLNKSSSYSKNEDETFFVNGNQILFPAGAIANSLFTDTLKISWSRGASAKSVPVNLTNKGIAWRKDLAQKFHQYDNFKTLAEEYAKPPAWPGNAYEVLGEEGFKNEDFIVWMRKAGLPKFRKLWRVVDIDRNRAEFKDGLPEGNYTVTIGYNYKVRPMHARKRFIVSTTSWLGGKTSFLGIAYIVTGVVCVLTGLAFLALHQKFGKTWSELSKVDVKEPWLPVVRPKSL